MNDFAEFELCSWGNIQLSGLQSYNEGEEREENSVSEKTGKEKKLYGKPDTPCASISSVHICTTPQAHTHTHGSKVKLALLSSPNWEELLPGQEGVRF